MCKDKLQIIHKNRSFDEEFLRFLNYKGLDGVEKIYGCNLRQSILLEKILEGYDDLYSKHSSIRVKVSEGELEEKS